LPLTQPLEAPAPLLDASACPRAIYNNLFIHLGRHYFTQPAQRA
jgi:hypothetical protein